jgi:8-oxo-dGTP diphosphatase/2-hydroxy-dATP diphosphatase
MDILQTLCIVRKDSQILLGMKKRGFGKGRWNGFGGKVSEGESIEQATVREIEEESGLQVRTQDIEKHGILTFHFENEADVLEVHIFFTTQYTGTPTETEEMLPAWFEISEIPYDDMWPDDRYWLPELLEGKYFTGSFLFGKDTTILEKNIKFSSQKNTLIDVLQKGKNFYDKLIPSTTNQ